MKPGEETPQDWQQPAENLSQAPYQAPPEQPDVPRAPTIPSQQPAPSSPEPIVQVDSPSDPQQMEDTSDDQYEEVSSDEGDDSQSSNVDADDDNGDDGALLRWQATEYIHHERTAIWYIALVIVVIAFILLAVFVFHSVTFAILIPVMLVALVVYVRRAPSVLDYTLSRKGLHINDKLYTYEQFKAFGVVSHEGTHSVVLLPRKRFQVSQTVYFPEEVGESLVDMLAARLPMQEVNLDAIDRLLKKLRI